MLIQLETFTVYRDATESKESLLCFTFEGTCVTNPHISECGRFDVDATQYYGLSQFEVDEMDRYNSKHYDALYIE
jgi:hypothetical protein